jgi:putative glutamine amidotransferase
MRRTWFFVNALVLLTVSILMTFQGKSQHRLVLLHPTVSNIESMEWMVGNQIINIPGVEMLGVYSAGEAYDYSASERYLAAHKLKNYQLRKISGDIKPEEIYRENSCTSSFRKLFEESDAIIFFGGPDIPASVFGNEQHLLTVVTDPQRHYFETSLFFHLIGGSRNTKFKPFLNDNPGFIIRAFCLGMQTMNVAAGGTLVQDIPVETYHLFTLESVSRQPAENQHRSYESPLFPLSELFGGNFHPIKIGQTGYLKEIAVKSRATSPKVLSYHHQAVGRLGANMKVIATSVDKKIIEGLQHSQFKNVVGVQFHPESSSLYKPETKFTTIPGKVFSPYELLEKSNSMQFHQLFWKDFSEKVINAGRLIKE